MFEYLENMSSEVAAVSFVGKEYAKAKAKHPVIHIIVSIDNELHNQNR